MLFWLSGLAITLLTGIAASLYLWLVRRRNDEIANGLHALSGLRWREFSKLVLVAMQRRGLSLDASGDASRDPRSTFTLRQGGRHWQLSCKHGSAYRIGAAPVEELAASVRLSGAAGGILATEGRVEKEGHEAARSRNIEILDGPALWDALKPLIEDDLRQQLVHDAQSRARRHIGIAWLAAFALGAVISTALANWWIGEGQHPAPAPAQASPAAAAPAAASAVAPYREPTEEELEDQRLAISRALAHTPGVIRGVWQTRLTLTVDYSGSQDAVWPRICEEVERYPALRTVRVQMNPPQGSSDPIRWRQCKNM